jgi:hypothetical protein
MVLTESGTSQDFDFEDDDDDEEDDVTIGNKISQLSFSNNRSFYIVNVERCY